MSGKLVIIGGAEDHQRHCTILKTVIELCGDKEPGVAVIATASSSPEEAGEDYEKVFGELGAGPVSVLNIESRESAGDPAAAACLQAAAAVFITGGDQLRLTSILGGTALLSKLRERFAEGAVIAGTSAGASALSGTMIVGGSGRVPPQRGLSELSPGLAFLPQVLIDQHFAQRGRFGRLLAVVALNPSLLGMGIDEDTAVIVREQRFLEVIGSFGVTIVDGSALLHSNITETAPRETLTLSSFNLHILARGVRFDLQEKQLVNGA